MAIFTTLASTIGVATKGFGLFNKAKSAVSNIFGGSGSRSPSSKPGAPTTRQTKRMLSKASTSEISRLSSLYQRAYNKGWDNARILAYDAYGGDQPQKNRNAKQRLKSYFNTLIQKYGSSTTTMQTGGSTASGSGGVIAGISMQTLLIAGAGLVGAYFLFNR